MYSIEKILYGILARLIHLFVSTNSRHWVFSADNGKSYREGSKYLMEYMLKHHTDYNCVFIAQNKDLVTQLCNRGIPCCYQYSLKGVYVISKASCIFYTHSAHDLFYDFKKNNRRYFYLIHGQPLKIASLALSQGCDYWEKLNPQNKLVSLIRKKIRQLLISDTEIVDAEFVSACSDFLKPFLEKDQANLVPVKILGMPRNDGLFDHERMQKEKWIEGLDGKFVITYMPTHRLYGHGEVTPTPFINRPDVQSWFKENNIVFLMKQHPNMIPKLKDNIDTETIKDITKLGLDPQVVIYHSDVLITDFSSVWMDYLLLRRPNIFYIYDDFEQNDAGCHYDIREDPPGHFCRNEDELYALIKQCRRDYVSMIPSDRIINKYHKFVDGNSCQRYFEEITNGK